jgi:hypothetical protein
LASFFHIVLVDTFLHTLPLLNYKYRSQILTDGVNPQIEFTTNIPRAKAIKKVSMVSSNLDIQAIALHVTCITILTPGVGQSDIGKVVM